MKVLFAMDRWVNAGSIQAVANYVRAGDALGHTIAVYGRPDPTFPGVRFSNEPGAFDYVVFIVESSLKWMTGLRMPRILSDMPRERRAILDADGMYNPLIAVDGYDRNHADENDRLEWLTYYDLLTDRILQPTLNAYGSKVISLPFYGYSPSLELSANHCLPKPFDVLYVGHNWWRWQEMSDRLLPTIERVRELVGDICFVGSWWDGVAPLGSDPRLERAFRVDRERLERLRIQVQPAVPYMDVIPFMSKGRINIMMQRPLFRRLKFLTSKYFEILCADTIPLVMVDADHAEAVYGPAGRELALDGSIADKLLDALGHPQKYREVVQEVRRHLVEHHSYPVRVRELVAALEH